MEAINEAEMSHATAIKKVDVHHTATIKEAEVCHMTNACVLQQTHWEGTGA